MASWLTFLSVQLRFMILAPNLPTCAHGVRPFVQTLGLVRV